MVKQERFFMQIALRDFNRRLETIRALACFAEQALEMEFTVGAVEAMNVLSDELGKAALEVCVEENKSE